MKAATLGLLALGCATPALALAYGGQFLATIEWLVLEALILGLGWHFRWSSLDRQRVATALGSQAQLARAVPFPTLAPAAIAASTTDDVIDLREVAPEHRLPPVDLAAALAALPEVAPRNWHPKGAPALAAELPDYVALAGVDLAAELKHLDVLCRRSRRPQA